MNLKVELGMAGEWFSWNGQSVENTAVGLVKRNDHVVRGRRSRDGHPIGPNPNSQAVGLCFQMPGNGGPGDVQRAAVLLEGKAQWDELVNDSAEPVCGRVGHHGTHLAVGILAEAMHGQAVRQYRRSAKLGQRERLDLTSLKISIEDATVPRTGVAIKARSPKIYLPKSSGMALPR